MEINATLHSRPWAVLWLMVAFIALPLLPCAQPNISNYSVRNNKMYIALGKGMPDVSVDSFAQKFNLQDLSLRKLLRGQNRDSLKLWGWKVELDNEEVFIISKSLLSPGNFDNPADRIRYTEKNRSLSERFPVVSQSIRYGMNRFRNNRDFTRTDSLVTFILRGHQGAKKVMLAGSFNDWKPDALAMQKTDSGWIANVPLRPGKYWYKFIEDGRWMTDPDNQVSENDGQGNTNSVYFRPNHLFYLAGFPQAKRVLVSGSFNNWNEAAAAMIRTSEGWQLPVYLAEGTHTYRFIVDRKWLADPSNPDRFPNEFGEFNSVLRIGKPYLFYLPGHTDAKQVMLSGSFNNWRTDELVMQKTGEGWELKYTLGPGNYEYNFIIDGSWAKPATSPENNSGNFYFVIGSNHEFRLNGFPGAKSVYLAGDFNNWSPNTFAMKNDGGSWKLSVYLSPGKHLYKFVVDGKWIIDPANDLWEQNEENTGNSVLWVKE